MKKRPIELVLEMLILLADVSETMDFQSFKMYCRKLDERINALREPAEGGADRATKSGDTTN